MTTSEFIAQRRKELGLTLILSLLAGIIMVATVLLAATGASIIFGGIVVFVLLRVIAAILEHLEAIRENTETNISNIHIQKPPPQGAKISPRRHNYCFIQIYQIQTVILCNYTNITYK